jgi:trehalose 6-phosphate phosphatase
MNAPEWIQRTLDAYQHGRALLLLFDFDGTLTPIVDHPDLARLPKQTRELLGRLSLVPKLQLGIISGRMLTDVKDRVPLSGVYFAGSGGLEIELKKELRRYPITPTLAMLLAEIHTLIDEKLPEFPGTWLERKPAALSLHYRHLAADRQAALLGMMADLLQPISAVRFRSVSAALEVTPWDGWDKGTAVQAIVAEQQQLHAATPFVVYFGDAANDAEGMAATHQLGGYTIGIGPDAPAVAMDQLQTPEELYSGLCTLQQHLLPSPVRLSL